jgi:hypothetical protein
MTEPGIHNITADRYHADDLADVPTLSASIANILIGKSPAHAKAAHPKLNPDLEREDDSKFDVGTAAHRLFLEGEDAIGVVHFPDWRQKEARETRDAIRQDGRIPLLADQADRVRDMVEAARDQLVSHHAQPALFTDGKPEQTLVWEDDHGVVCRSRLDWLRDDFLAIDDLKTTSASSDPKKWERTAYGMGADLQVAFYRRGVEKLTGVSPWFRYVVVETFPPYALSVVDLAPSALALAEDKVQTAIDLWAACLENDHWPAYDERVASIEVPTFEEMRWLERMGAEAAA